jgi:hypothetical protein
VISFVITSTLILFPITVFAAEQLFVEIFTYGGTADITADALKRVALIASSPQYIGLFAAFAVLSIALGSGGAIFKTLSSGNFGFSSWIWALATVVLGLGIYVAFIAPKDDMHVTDLTTNESYQVADVPNGIATLAGLTSAIESGSGVEGPTDGGVVGIIDSVDISGMKYRNMAGGSAFKLVMNVFSGGFDESNLPSELSLSLKNYWNDCVLVEMARSDRLITERSLLAPPDNDLIAVLARAAQDSYFTEYVKSNGEKVVCTCGDAWLGTGIGTTGIEGMLNDMVTKNNSIGSTYRSYIKNQCAASGFNVYSNEPGVGALAESACHVALEETFGYIFGVGAGQTGIPAVTTGDIIAQNALAKEITSVLKDGISSEQTSMLANLRIASEGIGKGSSFSEYMPVIKVSVMGIFLVTLPFVVLLLPGPLFGKVLSYIFGGFIFFTLWTITDAVTTGFGVNQAMKVFAQLQDPPFGMRSQMLVSGLSMKALSIFGMLRVSSAVLALAITGMLVKFGGHAMSSFMSGAVSTIGGAGAAAGSATIDPANYASTFQSYATAGGKIKGTGDFIASSGMDGMEAAAYGSTVSGYGGGLRSKSAIDTGGGIAEYAASMGNAGVFDAAGWESMNKTIESLGGQTNAFSAMTKVGQQAYEKQAAEAIEWDNLAKTMTDENGRPFANTYALFQHQKGMEVGMQAGRLDEFIKRGIEKGLSVDSLSMMIGKAMSANDIAAGNAYNVLPGAYRDARDFNQLSSMAETQAGKYIQSIADGGNGKEEIGALNAIRGEGELGQRAVSTSLANMSTSSFSPTQLGNLGEWVRSHSGAFGDVSNSDLAGRVGITLNPDGKLVGLETNKGARIGDFDSRNIDHSTTKDYSSTWDTSRNYISGDKVRSANEYDLGDQKVTTDDGRVMTLSNFSAKDGFFRATDNSRPEGQQNITGYFARDKNGGIMVIGSSVATDLSSRGKYDQGAAAMLMQDKNALMNHPEIVGSSADQPGNNGAILNYVDSVSSSMSGLFEQKYQTSNNQGYKANVGLTWLGNGAQYGYGYGTTFSNMTSMVKSTMYKIANDKSLTPEQRAERLVEYSGTMQAFINSGKAVPYEIEMNDRSPITAAKEFYNAYINNPTIK